MTGRCTSIPGYGLHLRFNTREANRMNLTWDEILYWFLGISFILIAIGLGLACAENLNT